jgi:hypothetical protein
MNNDEHSTTMSTEQQLEDTPVDGSTGKDTSIDTNQDGDRRAYTFTALPSREFAAQLAECLSYHLPGLEETERSIFYRVGAQQVVSLVQRLANEDATKEKTAGDTEPG